MEELHSTSHPLLAHTEHMSVQLGKSTVQRNQRDWELDIKFQYITPEIPSLIFYIKNTKATNIVSCFSVFLNKPVEN